jgi:preprotein translocase subunit SecG
MTFLFYLAIMLFILLCLVLCGVILIQEGKGSGLGASFGGDAGNSLFGTAIADVLKRFTAYLVAIFLISSLFLNFWTESISRPYHRSAQSIEQIEN